MNAYSLPSAAQFGGKAYPHRTAWQEILKLLGVLDDPSRPEFLRWQIALEYFFLGNVPRQTAQAAEYLAAFLTCGQEGSPGPKRFDWQHDAPAIIADINAVAGREVRAGQDHWWTFLSWFQSIGQGQLSTLVRIRDKQRRGKKLEPWEQEFYAANRSQVQLKHPQTPAEQAEKARLNAQLERTNGTNNPSEGR